MVSTLANFDNIPRKKKKFVNYLKNSQRYINEDKIEQIWTLISDKYEEMSPKKVEVPKKRKVVPVASDSDSSEWEDSDSDDDDEEDDKAQAATSDNTASPKRETTSATVKKIFDSKKLKTLHFMLALKSEEGTRRLIYKQF